MLRVMTKDWFTNIETVYLSYAFFVIILGLYTVAKVYVYFLAIYYTAYMLCSLYCSN